VPPNFDISKYKLANSRLNARFRPAEKLRKIGTGTLLSTLMVLGTLGICAAAIMRAKRLSASGWFMFCRCYWLGVLQNTGFRVQGRYRGNYRETSLLLMVYLYFFHVQKAIHIFEIIDFGDFFFGLPGKCSPMGVQNALRCQIPYR